MSGRNMALDVLVRLRDLMSGPLKRAEGVVKGFTNTIRKIGLVGTAIAAISFTAPIAQAAEFQQKLLDIAGTAELTHQAAFDFVNQQKKQYESLAFVSGQFSDTIAAGAGQMIAAGLDRSTVDASLASIAKNATAANTEFADMAGVGVSLLQTLRVPADQLDSALAGLIVSGKLGAFEMKDMARYFPTLTSQVAKFGVTGREAVNFLGAALQIAKKGTAEPAEAANNLKNFLSKILAPATIKNFKDAGVDIEAVMKDAATKGINPIEAVIQKISKLTGVSGKEIDGLMKKAKANGLQGADALAMVRDELVKIHGAGKLGSLFQDQQVMDFLIPMLANLEEYKQIKDKVAAATGANSQADFETQMQGLSRQFVEFQETGVQAIREVGLAFGTWLPTINQHLQAALKWLRDMDAQTGGLVRRSLAFAGAAIFLAGALGALGIVLPFVKAGFMGIWLPIKGAASALIYFGRAASGTIALQSALAAMDGAKLSGLARIGAGLRGIAMAIPGVSMLTGIFTAIGSAIATVSAPVWLFVAAIAAAGLAIYRYWLPIKAFFSGFAEAVSPAILAVGSATGELAARMGIDTSAISETLGTWKQAFVGWWNDLKAWFSSIDFGSLIGMKQYSAAELGDFQKLGHDIGQAIVDGIKSAIDSVIEWFRALPSRIMSAIGKIDISGLISWPALPSWLGGGGSGGAPQPPATAEPPPNQNVKVDTTLTVKAAPGTTVTNTTTQTSGKGSSAVNTGKSVGAP